MPRVDITSPRCHRCKLRGDLCYCERVTSIPCATRISIVMHATERERTSSTARLLEMALSNCEMVIVGEKDAPPAELSWSKNVPTFLLFPEPSAPILTHEFLERIKGVENTAMHLVVPDGTWSQARRIVHRCQFLMGIPRLQLGALDRSEYKLRRNEKEGAVCTAEAVAHALGVIEGEAIKRSLLSQFFIMRDSVLRGRRRPAKGQAKEGNV